MKRSLLSDCFIPQIIPTEITLDSDVPTVECTVDTIKKSLGSSFVSIGQTKVICTVAGPRANQKAGSSFSDAGILECEARCVQCSVNFETTSVQNLERQLSNSVKNALESAVRLEVYPKSAISIQCVVLEYSEHTLSALIVCASLALANAGIEMYDLVSAWTRTHKSTPSEKISTTLTSNSSSTTTTMTMAEMVNTNEVTLLLSEGRSDFDTVGQLSEECHIGCVQLRDIMASCLKQRFTVNGGH